MNNDEVRESSVSRNNQFSALFLLYRFRRPKADSSVASKKTKLNEIKLSTGKTVLCDRLPKRKKAGIMPDSAMRSM